MIKNSGDLEKKEVYFYGFNGEQKWKKRLNIKSENIFNIYPVCLYKNKIYQLISKDESVELVKYEI